ncbi:Rossmann-like and DUF2520 domain-containing protein [Thermobrachium celere]|uniref:DUF2520 domain-containing protein n=1 Tax=Thermobrachium celere DSM 8682 TaxID=941824 RepID=R7RMX6_9CLOT|nr:Rossmann-like and DUF2520 domain-containing protein [Thermobrachium celere]CDF57404.1 FIG173306: hypothetical protein [Thermobrachium celere DSM 8682]
MKIGFIGAGKVGSAFGRYLKEQGLEIYGYFSKTSESAKSSAEFTSSREACSIDEIVENCDYIFITTPDDVILEIASHLKHFNLQDKKIFHMSGSLSSNVFFELEEKGAHGYSLHPIFPFPDRNVYKYLKNAYFTIEGKNLELIIGFLEKISINYIEIPSYCKEKYHAAMVFASNYIVALAKISKELLKQCDFPDDKIEKALYPLMISAVENIKEKGIEGALTGPIVRGDVGTVKKHLQNIGEYKHIYSLLGEVALSITAERRNLDSEKLHLLLRALREE